MIQNCFCAILFFIVLMFSAKTDNLPAFSSINPSPNSTETSTDKTLEEFSNYGPNTFLRNITQRCPPQTILYYNVQSRELSKFYSPYRPTVSRVFLRI
jgi:hypothetical protein